MSDRNPADFTMVRRHNARHVLMALRGSASVTLSELARSTGLSRRTTGGVLDDLVERGLAEELAPSPGSSGRPAKRYRFRGDAGRVVGIAIAPDHLVATVVDLDGVVLRTERQRLDPETPAPERLRAIEALAKQCAEGYGPVWAAAAGTSGVVNAEGRITLATQIPGWTGLELAATVGRWFDCPGAAGNDAHYAAVAEHWKGNARFARDMAFLLTGHRSGFALIIDGRLHVGRSGAAGEFGNLAHLHENEATELLASEGITLAELLTAAQAGDVRANDVVSRMARGVAQGTAVLAMAIDPEVVVLGGPFAKGNPLLLDRVREELVGLCINPPVVELSCLGDEAVALGAARTALDLVESSERMFGSAELSPQPG